MLTVAALTPSLDLTYLLDTLTLGEIHRTSDVLRYAGGKALNMARAAATMGADTQAVAILGGATGDVLAGLLTAEGLPVTSVRSPCETRTCVSIATAEPPGLTEVYQEAMAVPEDVWDSFCSTLDRVLRERPGWLSVSGQAPAGSTDQIAELVRLGHRRGVRVAVDSHGAALPAAVDAQPDLVKVNRVEAAELLGAAEDGDLAELAAAIRHRTGRLVVLTDGVVGSVAVDTDRTLRAEPPRSIGRFPVGSGDAFLGGLLAALDRDADLREALRLGAACGVANAQVPGQGHFDAAAAEGLAREVRLEPGPATSP